MSALLLFPSTIVHCGMHEALAGLNQVSGLHISSGVDAKVHGVWKIGDVLAQSAAISFTSSYTIHSAIFIPQVLIDKRIIYIEYNNIKCCPWNACMAWKNNGQYDLTEHCFTYRIWR